MSTLHKTSKMKKVTLIGVFTILTISIYAQESKKMWLSGIIGLNAQTDKTSGGETKTNQFEVGPQFGYMITDRMAIGLEATYSNYNTNSEFAYSKSTRQSLNISPFYRYYISNGEKLKFFGQANVFFGLSERNYEDYSPNNPFTDIDRSTQFGVSIKPGLQYFLKPAWSIQASIGEIGYSNDSQKIDEPSESKTESFNFNIDLSTISFGLLFHF